MNEKEDKAEEIIPDGSMEASLKEIREREKSAIDANNPYKVWFDPLPVDWFDIDRKKEFEFCIEQLKVKYGLDEAILYLENWLSIRCPSGIDNGENSEFAHHGGNPAPRDTWHILDTIIRIKQIEFLGEFKARALINSPNAEQGLDILATLQKGGGRIPRESTLKNIEVRNKKLREIADEIRNEPEHLKNPKTDYRVAGIMLDREKKDPKKYPYPVRHIKSNEDESDKAPQLRQDTLGKIIKRQSQNT